MTSRCRDLDRAQQPAPEPSLLPRNRNGGRHCCQPPLRRAKVVPVFVTRDACTPPSLDPGSPAQASRSDQSSVRRQIPDPSAALLGSTLFSRLPLLREAQVAATERPTLPAPLASWSDTFPVHYIPKDFTFRPRTIACRRRSDPWSLVVFRRVALPSDGPKPRPRSPIEYALATESHQAESSRPRLWITGIALIT